MKKLQCVIHAPSSNTLLMKQKVTEALIAKTSNLEISISNPFETNAKDILEADGLLIGTTENLASMAGATKDFFDRTYYDLLGKKEGSFFLAYPDLKAKMSKDKTRFYRIKSKLMKSMYELCVRHDIFKDTQMTARQENMFRDKYLFALSQPDLIKKYAISSKEDFNSLDQDACEKLITVYLTLV